MTVPLPLYPEVHDRLGRPYEELALAARATIPGSLISGTGFDEWCVIAPDTPVAEGGSAGSWTEFPDRRNKRDLTGHAFVRAVINVTEAYAAGTVFQARYSLDGTGDPSTWSVLISCPIDSTGLQIASAAMPVGAAADVWLATGTA